MNNTRFAACPSLYLTRKYGVSGAQPPAVFIETLEKSFAEWRTENPEIKFKMTQGQSCNIDGNCD